MRVDILLICKSVWYFDCFILLQKIQPQPLAKPVYKHKLDQFTVVTGTFTSEFISQRFQNEL
jgi:hypothetical protein